MIENQCFFMGRLVRNNEPKQFQSQNGVGLVLKNAIAINGRKKDDEPTFIDFTAWNNTAKYLADYSNKGDKIAISGEMITEKWQDNQTGEQKKKLVLRVADAKIIATAKNNNENQAEPTSYGNYNQTPPTSYGNYNQMPAEVKQAVTRNNNNWGGQNNTQSYEQNVFENAPDEIPF